MPSAVNNPNKLVNIQNEQSSVGLAVKASSLKGSLVSEVRTAIPNRQTMASLGSTKAAAGDPLAIVLIEDNRIDAQIFREAVRYHFRLLMIFRKEKKFQIRIYGLMQQCM